MSIYNYKIEFVYHTLIRYRAMFILIWQCHVDVEEWFSRFLEFIVWFRFVSHFSYSVSFRFSVYRCCFVSSCLVSFRFAVFRFCFVSHFTVEFECLVFCCCCFIFVLWLLPNVVCVSWLSISFKVLFKVDIN